MPRLRASQIGAPCPVILIRPPLPGWPPASASYLRPYAASAKQVDATLDAVLPRPQGRQARVQQAMRYAITAGGKRLRPFLVLHSARLFGVDDSRSLRVGAAIEVAAYLLAGP